MSIKQCIVNALEDLTQTDLSKFCDQLRERPQSPRIRRKDVEDKSILEIANRMVSTFTETKALQVALDTLRQINCNQEAKTLEQNTKALLDTGDPTFHKTSAGELETKPSQEALKYVAPRVTMKKPEEVEAHMKALVLSELFTTEQNTKALLDTGDPTFHKTSAGELETKPSQEALKYVAPHVTMKKPEEVEADAKALVLSERGDPCNNRLVLSRYKIQFGKYKDNTFRWLLENDVGWTAYIVAVCKKEQGAKGSKRPQSSLDANKDALTEYVSAYPEVLEEVRFHHAYEKSREAAGKSGQNGKVPVGFGAYRWETLEDLYESNDPQKKRCVGYLRNMDSKCNPGSKMEFAVKYILQRDRAKTAATKSSGPRRRNQSWSDGGRHMSYRL